LLRAPEFRCPACSQVLGRFRRARLAVGCPFLECPRCHAYAERPATNEWALLGPGERAFWLADRLAPFLVVGLVPALAYWALVLRDGRGDPRTWIALLCAGPFLVACLPLSSALGIIRRSRTRMGDPMYRARLIEFSRRVASAGRP